MLKFRFKWNFLEGQVDEILGLPEKPIIPIGYPLGHFGPVSRASLEQVTFLDRWGANICSLLSAGFGPAPLIGRARLRM